MTNYYLIVAEYINETQRELITAQIKEHTDEWWHQFADVWIVDGGAMTAKEWRERLGVFVPNSPSGIIVIQLPPEGARSWSARAPRGKWDWLGKKYASPDGSPPDPA